MVLGQVHAAPPSLFSLAVYVVYPAVKGFIFLWFMGLSCLASWDCPVDTRNALTHYQHAVSAISCSSSVLIVHFQYISQYYMPPSLTFYDQQAGVLWAENGRILCYMQYPAL